MKYNYFIIRDQEGSDFRDLKSALKYINKRKIKIISLSEWQWGYTILYLEKEKTK